MSIDYSVYPDALSNDSPHTDEDRAEYVARVCGAWDFGVIPTRATFTLFRSWKPIFDRYPLRHSPAYAAFRSWYHWSPVTGGSIMKAHYERLNAFGSERIDDYLG